MRSFNDDEISDLFQVYWAAKDVLRVYGDIHEKQSLDIVIGNLRVAVNETTCKHKIPTGRG